MILYGRDLSPFTRRVAIWMALQGREVERRPVAMTDPADRETLRAVNPLARVPTLVNHDGAMLCECFAICDWLDETAPDRRLVPAAGEARRATMARIAVASATTDKAVALFYEAVRRPEAYRWADWIAHLSAQVNGGLDLLEQEAPAAFWGGEAPDGSDIAVACLSDFVAHTGPQLEIARRCPGLAAHAARAATLAPFAGTRPG